MKYAKPNLVGYSAITAIHEGNNPPVKFADNKEPNNSFPSDPAYQADE